MVTNPSANMPPPVLNQQQLIFDFTKRKRWADLLISELTEAIMLILSQTGQVWYCGPAVKELLGWKDEEVIDTNISDIMNRMSHASTYPSYS
jgi:PAS domain S-box-containing protein